MGVSMLSIPGHIAVVMDGNRRYAKKLMKKPWLGHRFGLEKAREVLVWTCESGIRYMTVYTLSLENLHSRSKQELNAIYKYVEAESNNIMKNLNHPVHRFGVQIRFIGRIKLLPKRLQEKLRDVEERTKKYKNHFLNVALAYGGQQEIVDATRKILRKGLKGIIRPSDVNETVMREHLWTNGHPEIDVVLRTGGEKRLSNFLPFQTAYAELIFSNKLWPEFTKKDFHSVLREFSRRQRRFGG